MKKIGGMVAAVEVPLAARKWTRAGEVSGMPLLSHLKSLG
jgi:hypothetical protein